MDNKAIQHIIKEAKDRLSSLLEEAKLAELAKQKRDLEIIKFQSVIELFSSSEDDRSDEESDDTVDLIDPSNLITSNTAESSPFIYSNYDTWEGRLKGYFKFKAMVLTISQIVAAFEPFEPSYRKEKLKGAVTNAIANMHKKGLLKVYDPGFKMRGFYYGNPLWFEGENLKEEYKPDLKEKLLW